jgi:inosine-uridine nucleoside N-ribohydrolase
VGRVDKQWYRRVMKSTRQLLLALATLAAVAAISLPPCPTFAQEKRKVIIDQDCSGPGGSNMQSVLALVNSPDTDVLGIAVVTGDQWRDEEVAHMLRLLEIIGRTDIRVYPGAEFPLLNSRAEAAQWEKRYGPLIWQGAWKNSQPYHAPQVIPPMPEGAPTTKPADEDAAHFMIRTVREYPHEVTIFAAGPMTDLALAQAIDPEFASLAKELVIMGGSIDPITKDPEFAKTPRHEFNFWMDPEAARLVLRSPWARIEDTTVDISIKTWTDKTMVAEIANGTTPAAQYVAKYALPYYMWDEIAAVAWLDPSIITRTKKLYLDVSIDHGATYGDTLDWPPSQKPDFAGTLADVQLDLDKAKFYKEFVDLMTRSAPQPAPQ